MLQVSHLTKEYAQPGGRLSVLVDLNLNLRRGESAALCGESGSGKSTLLHLLAGLDVPDTGEIVVDGQATVGLNADQLAELRREKISLVFQQYHLLATLNVADNVRIQAALCNRLDAVYEQHLIERLGLEQQLAKYPHQLSGGQQQRVAIARALLHKPVLLLADEPTGNLDENSSAEVMSLFTELVVEAGVTVLMVTHSRDMAAFMDRQFWLHEGKLTERD